MNIVFRFVSVLFFGCLSLPAMGADTDIQPWSESLFVQLEKEFGKEGAERVRKLHELMLANRGQPTDVKLKLVNDSINQLPWIADRSKYDADDYWATPLETIATFGGDCEDMAIAKLMMLRMMGIPKEKLRLAYVKPARHT